MFSKPIFICLLVLLLLNINMTTNHKKCKQTKEEKNWKQRERYAKRKQALKEKQKKDDFKTSFEGKWAKSERERGRKSQSRINIARKKIEEM